MDNVLFVDFKARKRLKLEEVDPGLLETIRTPSINDERCAHFDQCMSLGMTQIVVNAVSQEVKVPDEIRSPETKINWSHKFGIPDFLFDGLGVRGTLSFAKKPFFVDIPWDNVSAIYNLSDQKGTEKTWTVNE